MSALTASLLISPFLETLYMVFVSGLIACVFGLPLGILLFVTRQIHLLPHRLLNISIGFVVNTVRSIPYIILMIALIPLARLITGSSIGTNAAIVTLSIAAIPFVARLVETALNELPTGLIEAAVAMGATTPQTLWRILIPEALPQLIDGITLTLINLVAYSAMAGTIGGGGLGDLAIRYGYQRFDMGVMIATIVVLVILVQCIQIGGQYAAQHFNRK